MDTHPRRTRQIMTLHYLCKIGGGGGMYTSCTHSTASFECARESDLVLLVFCSLLRATVSACRAVFAAM